MTAYEYMDLAYSGFGLVHTTVSLVIAILSGYLVVAYTVGSKLTRLQVSALNIAYSVWASYLGASGALDFIRARSLVTAAAELNAHISTPTAYMVHFYVSIGLLMWLASLWFMWIVRRAKAE